MGKFRGFKAVSRMFQENEKILYPSRSKANTCKYDIYNPNTETIILEPSESTIIPTGLKFYMLDNEFIQIISNHGNIVKDIDNSMTKNDGEIYIPVVNNTKEKIEIKFKDKIATAKILRYYIADYDYVREEKREQKEKKEQKTILEERNRDYDYTFK